MARLLLAQDALLPPDFNERAPLGLRILRADLRFPFPPDFERQLTGARIQSLSRRAKYLLAHIHPPGAPEHLWLSHLGMSGRFQVHPANVQGPGQLAKYKHGLADAVAQKHVHVTLDLDDGTRVTYADPRRFGFMDLTPLSVTSRFLADLGPEPTGNEFNADYFLAACAGRQSPIKAVLLNQKIVAGLGNIYVCEALFRARISPRRKAANLGPVRVGRLVPAIRDVLGEAVAAGGSSLRDFAHSDGKLGYFQHGFAVYDRAGAPCTTNGCDAKITRIVQSGRSSFYCPACQR